MDWGLAIGVAITVVVLGGIAAVLWWRLANKAAPYRDGGGKPAERHENIVVIKDKD